MKLMMRIFLTSLCVLLLSACSAYKTNSTKKFYTTDTSFEKPVIHVGKLEQDISELNYVGWIEAEIKKGNIFAHKPTPQMADIILAELAQEQGAHAVIHTEYKYTILGNLSAKGQAVKFKDPEAYLKLHKENQRQRRLAMTTAAAANEEIMASQDKWINPEPEILTAPQNEANIMQKPVAAAAGNMNTVDVLTANVANKHSGQLPEPSDAELNFVPVPIDEYEELLAALYELRDQARAEKDLRRYKKLVNIIAKLEFFQ